MFISANRPSLLLCIPFCITSIIHSAIGASSWEEHESQIQQPLKSGHQHRPDDGPQIPLPSKPHDPKTIPAMLDALDVMQDQYFELWQGMWSSAIDWTSAVIGTYLSSVLLTLSTFDHSENLIDEHFSQLTASYFGQDAFSLRQEAYDDMLWVVLGWLESIKFINSHASMYSSSEEWHGKQFTPAFAHRARLFWEFASKGWDTKLCHGGMIWSPYLGPYKNAITNELFIAASISMYLYFPGDDNDSPFMASDGPQLRDAKYLAAAIEAYKWLSNIDMKNEKGLYIDGFHISNWSDESRKKGSKLNMTCDIRDEMVYTYNQGVLLTGQRGLYEATGAKSYLQEGHKLVESVIVATGYNLSSDSPPPPPRYMNRTDPELGVWHGLGRSGVLEDSCDSRGYCSQDGQTFKGIFFHHFTTFCTRLPDKLAVQGGDSFVIMATGFEEVAKWHDEKCSRYAGWIRHNAHAALRTRDDEGRFGMWWGAPQKTSPDFISEKNEELPDGAVDYRNRGIPDDRLWRGSKGSMSDLHGIADLKEKHVYASLGKKAKEARKKDVNDRGRGRTVETQGGGIAVLRALWELVDNR